MTVAQDRLNQILPTWYSLLTQWSLDGSLVAAATDALVLDGSNAKQGSEGLLQSYVSQWAAGNFKNLPQIVLLSAEDISGARGAYANSTDTIYLNQDWLLGANAEDIQKVLTHELGHYLDDQLNKGDTKGDEGGYFSSILFEPQDMTDIATKPNEAPDAGMVVAEGSQIRVERATAEPPTTTINTDTLTGTFNTSGDDYYYLYINGALVGEDDGMRWPTAEQVTAGLNEGSNSVVIVGINNVAGPGTPGALIMDAKIGTSRIVTDSTWQSYINPNWQSLQAPPADLFTYINNETTPWSYASEYGDINSSTWWNRGPDQTWVSVASSGFPADSTAKWSWSDGFTTDNVVILKKNINIHLDKGDAIFRINGNGTGQDSQSLTCILDQLDPDGMTKLPPSKTGDPTTGYSYQWQVSSDEVNWSNATGTGATTFKYSVNTTSDANKFLRVQVGYTDDKGFNETVYTEQVKIISGTTKSDKFAGTAGVEVTFSGSGADAVATGAGNDFAKGGIGNDTFTGADGDGDDFFDGQTEIDIINYSASSKGVDIDFVTGLATERTVGGIGKDSFAGIENARGTTGADSFKGSTGVNIFTGSGGADTFTVANAQAFGASTSDRITDMSSDDKIQVSASAFSIVGKPYSFAAVSGTKAVNASAALIVYDTGSGYVYLNKDGATSGLGGGGIFAVLDNKFAGLTAANVGLI